MATLGEKIKRMPKAYKESADKARGNIAAMQTLLKRFPILDSTGSFDGDNVTDLFSFTLDIFRLCGRTEEDIINMIASMLSNGNNGFLDTLENAVKGLLLLNLKEFFTCSMNPLLPNKLFYTGNGISGGEGITIPLSEIDPMRFLRRCPIEGSDIRYQGKKNMGAGSLFYFDVLEHEIYGKDNAKSMSPYGLKDMWQSMDFNAYLWRIINRDSNPSEPRQTVWDNRVRLLKKFKNNISLKNAYFEDKGLATDRSVTIDSGVEKMKRYDIIKCEYIPSPSPDIPDGIKVLINPYRYANRKLTVKVPVGKIKDDKLTDENKKNYPIQFFEKSVTLNSTIFEFNYEYIYSMKLFEPKTLVAGILDAIFGLFPTIDLGLSLEETKLKEMVHMVVEEMSDNDDVGVDDCYRTFSNEKLERSMMLAKLKHQGTSMLNLSDEERGDLMDLINQTGELNTDNNSVIEAFNYCIVKSANSTSSINDPLSYGTVDYKLKFNFASNLLDKLLKETVMQIVMQILSPKTVLLYMVNNEILGSMEDGGTSVNYKDLFKNFLDHVMTLTGDLVKLVKNEISKYLINQLMLIVNGMIELFALRVIKEMIDDYKQLLYEIVRGCDLSSFPLLAKKSNIQIDNVGYADIDGMKLLTQPLTDNCG